MPINNKTTKFQKKNTQKRKEHTVAKNDVEILIAGPDVEFIQDCCSCIFDSECLEQDGASDIKSIFTFSPFFIFIYLYMSSRVSLYTHWWNKFSFYVKTHFIFSLDFSFMSSYPDN